MNIFEAVKNNVSLREAVQVYGLEVNRHGKALCPFHNDRHPSLYVADDHYYCFACGAHGDVIDFTAKLCALPGFVDSKNEEKTERNAGYLVVSHSGGGMLRQGTRKGIRRTPANRGMRAHWVVKGLDISEDVCHGMCP